MRLFLFILAALLAGCAATPSRPPVADVDAAWRERQTVLARVTDWDLRGRVALRTGDEGFHISLQWLREAGRHRIDLSGPLGGGRVRLIQNENGAELRDADDKVYRDSSMQRLLRRRTGLEMPIEGMNFWVLGLPAPGAAAKIELDEWGRLKTMQQQGWDIRFIEYADYDGYELPNRVFAKRSSIDDGSEKMIEIRLIVEKWIFAKAKS